MSIDLKLFKAMTIEKWEKLICCLKFYESHSIQILNKDKIAGFETDNRIHLPQDYKDFIRVFGAGCFGDFIRIYSPSSYTYRRISESNLEWTRSYIKEYPSKDIEWDRELDDLLNNAFIFGGDDRGNSILWDLRSYKRSDDSYDIFWLDGYGMIDEGEEGNDVVFKIGRDFYKFICNFCCGLESYRILSDPRPPQPGDIRYEFTQYVEYVSKRD